MGRVSGAKNRDYDVRRTGLLARTGERLSAQQGDVPSFRELAASAGVSVATLRHYFPDRESLIKALFAQALLGAAVHLQRARSAEKAEDLQSALEDFLRRVVAGWTTGNVGALHRIGLAEGLRNPRTGLDYLTDVLEPTLQALEARLQIYIERGAMVAADTRHAALMLLSPLVLALLHQHDLGGARCRPLSIAALIPEHVAVFLRAYR